MSKAQQNPLEMTDEDFLKMSSPPVAEETPTAEEDPVEEEELEEIEEEDPAPEGDEPEGDEDPDSESSEEEPEEDTEEEEDSEADLTGDEGNGENPEDTTPVETSDEDTPAEGEKSAKKAKKSGEEVVEKSTSDADYKSFYEQVMKPFKANGKTIEIKDPSEVIQLMQMGANYTKKLQDIQPHRKVLLMLQNNELLDEGKLSFLIDLDKKDPEAIRKLVKDAGIDPMDIDTESESEYRGGNHSVTDEEAAFRGVMEDIASTDAGKETLQIIQRDFDDASKDVIWQQPEVMTVIQQQRENGIYDQITTELARLKTLGQIAANTPFLQAYKQVGDALFQQGAFGTPTQGNPNPGDTPQQGIPAKRKVGEGTAKPKPKVANGDKAKAASNRRSSPRQSKQIVNPLEMSDEEFMKMDNLKNRL